MKRLVVVESPTKARTIRGYLPKEYRIEASMGHIRDLPASASEIPAAAKGKKWARLGVNVDEGFEPLYVVPRGKKKVVAELKEALKDADELYIATDEDREGESIGWHLIQALNPKVPVRRMVFHEITKEAILNALDNTREIDQDLVEAQETRRVLDRLVGYSISPLLWKKIAPGLSAGRVQSVAVRVLVERERERLIFVPATYWDLKAHLAKGKNAFEAQMTHLGGTRLATGRDFDETTGKLAKGKNVLLLSEAKARALAEALPSKTWTITEVKERAATRKPYAPFTTSSLQQEANRKLGLGAKSTMQIAQKLYENGHITYMRTDSTNLSEEAVTAARRAVEERYGKEYVHPKPRRYANKVKNAQEAHEAIRPAGTAMKTRADLRLSGTEGALYDLIWKRTVASQMADARLTFTTATIEAGDGDERATFRASGKRIDFPGFFRAYVEGQDDPEAALEDRDQPLPKLDEGDTPACRKVEPLGHETKPPARYTEATIVKKLEEEGIGRPSTYASIIETIVNRGYARRKGTQLIPTFTAFATVRLLEKHFEQLVDLGFTASMEQVLDDIATGGTEARPYLEKLYRGKQGIETQVEAGLDQIDARAISTLEAPKWQPYVVRVGRYGPYVEGEKDGERITASLPDDLAPADLTAAQITELLESGNKADDVLGIHPDADQPVLLKSGPYGHYVQLGDDEQAGKPKRTSLPKGTTPEQVDLAMALGLLSLPREIGNHPETGAVIKSNIGRYGPYVQHGSTFASLTADDDVLTVGLDRAVELIKKKENKNKPLRIVGTHPETGDPIEVRDGRYGPYVKHKKTNATIPPDIAPEDVTLEQSLALLAEREAKAGTKKRKTTKKKTTAKKTTAKKKAPAKKKTPAKK